MKGKRSTKNALISSILVFALCVSMLIGATFAWFTDTASTGVNRIQAGTLDIELEYSKDGVNWVPVQPTTTDLFGDVALWEPGATSVAYLKLHNAGTLALKYQLGITATGGDFTNVADIAKNLKNALVFAQFAGGSLTKFDTRAEAVAAVENAGAVQGLADYAQASPMVAGETSYITLVVTMPTSVGNDYNYKNGTAAPEIDLGIKLVATQQTSEEDSFGSDYDTNATYPVIPDPFSATSSGNITAAAGGTLGTTNIGDAQIVVPANAVAEDTNAVFSMELTESNPDSVTFEISLKEEQSGDGITLSEPAKVTAVIGAGLINVEVKHSGTPMTQVTSSTSLTDGTYYYNKSNGKLTICTSSFSPFEIKYEYDGKATVNGVAYSSLSNALKAATDGDTVVLLKNASGVTIDNKNITLDLNGYTIKESIISSLSGAVMVKNGSTVTIKNGTISMKNTNSTGGYAGIYLTGGNNNVTLQNVVISSKSNGVWSNSGGNTVTIENTDITSNNIGVTQNGSYGGNVFTISNTKITDTRGVGVYISNNVNNTKQTLNIDGCTISGSSGVEIKHTNATITNSTFIGTTTPTSSRVYGNGPCTSGYAFAVSTNGEADHVTGNVAVSDCKFYSGTITEGESNGYAFVYQVAGGSSVTIDGTVVTDYNTYGGEASEGGSEG